MKQLPAFLIAFREWTIVQYRRYWLAVLLALFLLPAGVALYYLVRAKAVADELSESPPLTKRETKRLQKQVQQEKQLRLDLEGESQAWQVRAQVAEQRMERHVQKADSLTKTIYVHENDPDNYATASTERVYDFLAGWRPRAVYDPLGQDSLR